MEGELRKETVSINNTACQDSFTALIEEDIIIPDSKSDIAKILQIDSDGCISDITAEDGGASFSGKVNLKIMYIPDGDSRAACSAPMQMDFFENTRNARLTSSSKIIASCEIIRLEFTTLNSRKLAVRAVIEINWRAFNLENIPIITDMGEGIESHKNQISVYNVLCASKTRFPVRETLDFPSAKPSALSVLKCDARIADKDVHIVTGKVLVKGELSLCTLYVSSDNAIEFMEHSIPFSEAIDADGAGENTMHSLDLTVCEAEVTLRADSDGDMRIMEFSAVLGANLTISENTEISLVDDCYSCKKNLVLDTGNVNLLTLRTHAHEQSGVKTTMDIPDSAPEISRVYNLIAKPHIISAQVSDNTVDITGSVDCYILYLSSSSSSPLCSLKTKEDFSLTMAAPGAKEGDICDISCEVAGCSYNITMSGVIEIRCVLSVDADVMGEMSLPVINSVEDDEVNPLEMRHGIVIYYVKPGDTVWQIAKRYHVPMELLCAVNNLEDCSVISPSQRLLIPTR